MGPLLAGKGRVIFERGVLILQTAIEVKVRSTEVDFLGHVNNAKHLEYLEWGREDWYEKVGYSFDWLAERAVGTVTVNVNINYRRECGKGDLLQIRTAPGRVGRSSYVFEQEIVDNRTGETVSDAQVTTVVIDLQQRKSMAIPGYLLEHLGGGRSGEA